MKNKKKISDKGHQNDHIEDLENFIKQKNEENEVLKKFIDKINATNKNKNNDNKSSSDLNTKNK